MIFPKKSRTFLVERCGLQLFRAPEFFYWSATEVETFVGVENFTQTTLADES